jgi:hypothetical protein
MPSWRKKATPWTRHVVKHAWDIGLTQQGKRIGEKRVAAVKLR